MSGWKLLFPGHQLCSIPECQGLPCAMAVQYPWVLRGAPSSTASPVVQHPWVPGGGTMQERSLSPAVCEGLGLLIPPLSAPAPEGTQALPRVQALSPSSPVPLLWDRRKHGSG